MDRLGNAVLLGVALSLSCVPLTGVGAGLPFGAEGNRVPSRYQGQPLAVASSRGHARSRLYVVKQGDTLWSIARRHGASVKQVAALNGIERPELLRAGVRLRIPASAPGLSKRSAQGESSDTAGTQVRDTGSGRAGARSDKRQGGTTGQGERGSPPRRVLQWPVEGTLTSRYGRRGSRPHDGIDIGAERGTKVRAAAAGEVLFADEHRAYGNLVVVRHEGDLITVYAHNEMSYVRRGQRVSQGQVIARVGSTGRATGPHLHFEVRRGTRPDNPLRYLPP